MRHEEIKHKTNEGLADMADMAERDHEVQMARSDLYKLAKYAIKLHEMLKGVSEAKGLEGWQQAKITKAADYISSVYHNLDYEMKFAEQKVEEAKKSSYKDGLSAMLEAKVDTKTSNKTGADGSKEFSQTRTVSDKSGTRYSQNTEKGSGKNYSSSNTYADDKGKFMHAKDGKVTKGYDATIAKGLKHKAKQMAGESVSELCKECGKPSYKTLDEEKQKGVDGKVCWKGYKIGNPRTKQKGGKTVDNCVKM